MWYTNTQTGHGIDLSQVNYFSLIDPTHENYPDPQPKPLIVFRFLDNETESAKFQNMEEAQAVFDEIAAMLKADTEDCDKPDAKG